MNKANEITKDNQNSMNVNVESQTLEYVTNPSKFKEDIEKAKAEIADIFTASKESIHDRGDDNRNFFGQLGEVRLSKTINNIAGEKLEKTDNSEEIARTFEDTYADLGYKNTKVIFTTPENTPQLKDEKGNPKAGTAYVDKETGKRTILINVNDKKNHTKAGLIGTIAEEGSHVINALENRKVETGTDEKGLESTGRATNEYFKNLYSKNDKKITLKSDGEDYSNVDFGENVGDKTYAVGVTVGYDIAKIWHLGGEATVGFVFDDKKNKSGFISIGGSVGIGIGGGFGASIYEAYNPNRTVTVKDIEGWGQGFSASVATPIYSGSLSAGFDGELSLSQTKRAKKNTDLSASIDFNASGTRLISYNLLRSLFFLVPNGKSILNEMEENVWNTKLK